jgi:hypothetical protein
MSLLKRYQHLYYTNPCKHKGGKHGSRCELYCYSEALTLGFAINGNLPRGWYHSADYACIFKPCTRCRCMSPFRFVTRLFRALPTAG